MSSSAPHPQPNPSLTWSQALLWSAVAVISFHLAYSLKGFNWVILFYLVGLVKLASAKTPRIAFYLGFAVGLLVVAPRLTCFWNIFGMAAMALWCVVAFWTGLFVSLSQACLKRLGPVSGALLVAFLWTGLEYFRSELYYLKFSWLNIGYCFSDSPTLPVVGVLGMYGLGFTTALVAALIARVSSKQGVRLAARFALIVMVVLFAWAYLMERESPVTTAKSVTVAGVQLEFPTEREVLAELDKLIATAPEAELFVLSEYTLNGPVPQTILDWCRSHQRYLIIGGKDPAPNDNFYDTAFVVDPNGAVVFRQVKSVPIQFFKDGLPATEQRLWSSPWGKIGLCVCYDLSYTRVTDRLIAQGAQALIVPTMDVVDWGIGEHRLHARVAPLRSAEYRVPIFRVASSGISQLTTGSGHVVASAGVPGQGTPIVGTLTLGPAGVMPLDRWLGPLATGVVALAVLWLCASAIVAKRRNLGNPPPGQPLA